MGEITNDERLGPKRGPRGEREDPTGTGRPMPAFVRDVRINADYQIYQVVGFPVGKAELTKDVVDRLRAIVTTLQKTRDDQGAQITVIGTASDSRIQNLDADVLALDRAELIASALRVLGMPGTIHAVTIGTFGAPSKSSDMISKGLARGAFIHVRMHGQFTSSSETNVPFPAPVEEASLADSAKKGLKKFGEGVVGGLLKGKPPKGPVDLAKKLFESVGKDMLADFSNHVNAEKFGKECQAAFIESWADTMAHLMDDPRGEYRLHLQRFVYSRAKPDIRMLEAERLNLPRNGIYAVWQVGQFKLAGMFAAYDMVKRMREFEVTAAEWRRAYPEFELRKQELIVKALEETESPPTQPRRKR